MSSRGDTPNSHPPEHAAQAAKGSATSHQIQTPHQKGEQMAKGSEEKAKVTIVLDVREIPLESILLDDQMIRADLDPDYIQELALDIATNGLMQPIGVLALPVSHYQLLWGRCRFEAFRHLRRTTIPAKIETTITGTVKTTAARENLLRRQLTLQEEVDVVCALHTEEGLSPDSIASRISKSRAWVLRRLCFPSLPPELRSPVLDGRIAVAAAERLALLADPSARAYALSLTEREHLTVAQVNEVCAALTSSPNMEEAVTAGLNASSTSPSPPTLVATCIVCGTQKPLPELQLIRVCLHDCPGSDAQTDTHTQKVGHA